MHGDDDAGTAKHNRNAACVLASDILASYVSIRAYFRKVSQCIEHIDPHLCNNTGLVARLVEWEETWEIGARYVRSSSLLEAINDLVVEIQAVQRLVPQLTSMIEDCAVELFLVLPRLVMLCFLANPHQKRSELVRRLLPHRFGPVDGRQGAASMTVDPELKVLYDKYKKTVKSLNLMHQCSDRRDTVASGPVWEAVVQQAVRGQQDFHDDSSPTGVYSGTQVQKSRGAVDDLLLSIEKWSLELQRHCPEDWNQCSAVLVHCLMGGSDKSVPPAAKFQV